ncbi:MAG TPA: hypothetical protein VKV17_18360 [Bryobacteraceae bacterium]|nr:hypothetical protein [Bryobacteraceae bacterium]
MASTRQQAGSRVAEAVFSPEDLLARTLRFSEKEYAVLRMRRSQ